MITTHVARPLTGTVKALSPRQVGKAYNFPGGVTGRGYIGGIIELGGGYNLPQVQAYFARQGLPTPSFYSRSVLGGTNTPDGINGADGEVQLDMIVAGAIAPGATFNVYFAPNTDAGFLAAVKQAIAECHGVSISWGAPEDQWDPTVMAQFEAAFKLGRQAGVPVFVASGDTGADDGETGKHVDFPSSAPSAVACGGTRLEVNPDNSRYSETAWNDNPTSSATGGGQSAVFPGRQTPDVAGNADPYTGYQIQVDGQQVVIGGTSAVAPLMLGLHALLWEALGGKPFDFVNTITTNPSICFDVVSGDQRAGLGRDQATGFGVPDGTKLLNVLKPPAPTPQPAPVPSPQIGTKQWINQIIADAQSALKTLP